MKKCPYCKTSIEDYYIKCPKCKNYLDNSIFERLSKRDIKIIKKNDLTIYTPSLLALEMESIYPEGIFDEIDRKFPDDDIQYRYFLFKNYTFYKCSILRINKKLNSQEIIINDYKKSIVYLGAEFFNYQKGNKYSDKYLIELAYDVFEKLDNAMLLDDQPKISVEFSKIIFNESDIIKGFELYVELTQFFNTFNIFSSMFLVEEEDWNWQKALDKDITDE